MKFFHAPGSCSLGIRLILEETGAKHELHVVDFSKGEQRGAAYLALNPKGKVPALLRDDGTVLTEFPAIAFWLARRFPEAGLLPEDIDGQARALELTDYIVATLHMRGYTLIRRPTAFAGGEAAARDLAENGRAVLESGLAQLEQALGDGPFLMGSQLTVPDAAAFYLLGWMGRVGVALSPALAAYHARIEQRPAAQRALA